MSSRRSPAAVAAVTVLVTAPTLAGLLAFTNRSARSAPTRQSPPATKSATTLAAPARSVTAPNSLAPRSTPDPIAKPGTQIVRTTATTGRILAQESPRSALAERVARNEVPAGPSGTLFTVGRSGDGHRFLANMLSSDFARITVAKGWDLRTVGEDISWTPARCGAMPNALLGTRWLVQFDLLTDSGDPDGPGGADGTAGAGLTPDNPIDASQLVTRARLTLYDLQSRTFRELLPSDTNEHPFTATLAGLGDHQLSYLWAPGLPAGRQRQSWTRFFVRTIDTHTLAFRDEPVSLPAGFRVSNAFRWYGSVRLDLEDRAGEVVPGRMVGRGGNSWAAELSPGGLAIAGIDGYTTSVVYTPETAATADDYDTLVEERTGRTVFRFSHDRYNSVTIRAVRNGRVYFTYVKSRPGTGPTSRDLAVLDLATGAVSTAFADEARPGTTPRTDLIGVGSELFVAGLQVPLSKSSVRTP